jgi:hypothetical protein
MRTGTLACWLFGHKFRKGTFQLDRAMTEDEIVEMLCVRCGKDRE